MERTLRRDLAWGLAMGGWAGLSALALSMARPGAGLLAIVLPLLLVPLAWWIFCGATRWVVVFLAAAFLLPPLPLPWGDAGPHPALLVAAVGVWAGLARLGDWKLRLRPLPAAIGLLWFALLASVPLAALYSGPRLAAESLARVALFSISVYLYFYLADGPGRDLSMPRLIRLLFWTGFAAAAFACLDFYFQLPSPARFAEQFVWLPGGVFRRAQGLFYEASTLGLFCVFLLLMVAAISVLRLRRKLGLSALGLSLSVVVLLSALILSFSRAAMVSLGVSLAIMVWLERKRLGITRRLARLGAAVLGGVLAGGLILWWVVPDFLTAYLRRIWFSGAYLLEEPNLILSRRLDTWGFLLGYLGDHPWQAVFGIGYKTLPYTTHLGRPVIADNMYLSLLIEAGILGLAALVALHAAALATTWRWTASTDEIRRLVGVWMFCFWCGLALQMLSGDVLTYWRILPAFFAVLAAGVAAADDHPLP